MPLAGSLDIRDLLEGAPTAKLDERELCFEDVDILQVLYELKIDDRESLLPPALNPTIPIVVSFLVYRAKESSFGPFHLAQVRLTARAGVRPRSYLVSARCDNEALAERLAAGWGFRVQPGSIGLRRFHDRIEAEVTAGGQAILRIGMLDPEPMSGHDIQYPPGMHLAQVRQSGITRPRLIQVDSEYEFRRADRGRPQLMAFDAAAWGDVRLVPIEPVSASFAACNMTIANVRYVCNPDIAASESTEKVSDA
jgi:Acetoacetate decarboxylase (ADC)